jgi:hypothetical protein
MSTPLINFQDAVTADNLSEGAAYGVYYEDGHYANYTAVRERLPHAELFGITVEGKTGHDVFAVDSETGDLPVDATVAWVEKQFQLEVALICVYANLDRWEHLGLLSALEHYGDRIKRWVADYDDSTELPSWADAKQYADPGPIDKDEALANFFEPALAQRKANALVEKKPAIDDLPLEKEKPARTGIIDFKGALNVETGGWTIAGTNSTVHSQSTAPYTFIKEIKVEITGNTSKLTLENVK